MVQIFPLFRRLIDRKYDRIAIRNQRTERDFDENNAARDRRYQEAIQINSVLSIFIMIMMILLKTTVITNVKEWFLFDIAYVNVFLRVYKKMKEWTTVSRQREQIVWAWKNTFLLIEEDALYMRMDEQLLGTITRLRTRLESSKITFSGIFPRKMCFKSECFKELLEKGSMISQEEAALLMWLLFNLEFIVSVWNKIESGDILNFPKPKKNETYKSFIERVAIKERLLYRQLLQDTQVLIGCIMVIFLYGQRTQISNSIRIDTLEHVPDVGLVLRPIYEKITRRATGLTFNTQLEQIICWQIDTIRKKCNFIPSVVGLFVKRSGRPYTTRV